MEPKSSNNQISQYSAAAEYSADTKYSAATEYSDIRIFDRYSESVRPAE